MGLILRCVCGSEDFTFSRIHDIPVNVCKVCGIVHQNVDMTEKELEDFYKLSYSSQHQTKIGTRPYIERYEHDRGVARLRHNKYKLNGIVLDVGCGNGGFVDEGRVRGLNIFGTAISNDFDGANPTWVNLTGKTSMSQLFGLLKGSLGCFGFPGGNTIQSAHFGVPTAIVWNRYFRREEFYTNGVKNTPTYLAIKQKQSSPQEAADAFVQLVKG